MLIKRLTEIPGVSGDERKVREFIKEEIADYVTYMETDVLGNLIVFKEPQSGNSEPIVMLAAHMDEVGLMVTGMEKSGHLRFKKVGQIDDRVLLSKPVLVGPEGLPGVIGAKAVHLQKPKERKKTLTIEKMYIDIGGKDKEEVEKKVHIGDYVSFSTNTKPVGNDCFIGKAFDDRLGCALLVELLKKNYSFPLYAAFTVQEEIGLRGSGVVAYKVNPHVALVIEGTSAADVPAVKEHRYATSLGKGPAITVMDDSVITDKNIVAKLIEVAEKNNIPFQVRRSTRGGTDAGRIALTREGVKTAVVSIPCRYIHSPVSLFSAIDYQNTLLLVDTFLRSVENEGGI